MSTPMGAPITAAIVLAADDPAALARFYGALLAVDPQPGLSAGHWRVPWPAGGWLELYAPSRRRPQPRQPGRLALCLQRPAPPATAAPSGTATMKPEASNSEASKSEATKPEATKPEASKPEATKPEATKPTVSKPEASKLEAKEAEAKEPEASGAEASAELDAWIAAALGLGAMRLESPRLEPFGAEAWLLDPEGNRLLLLVRASAA